MLKYYCYNMIEELGSLIGDINGSKYEFNNVKSKGFALFDDEMRLTDDSVLTTATMKALLNSNSFKESYIEAYKKRPDVGYGYRFASWAESNEHEPYNSLGNGSAMRVSPVAYVAKDLDDCLRLAKLSAEVTHNHPEGIKGAQATAAAVYLAIHGSSKEQIKQYIADNYYPNIIDMTYESLKKDFKFDPTCPGTVPQAITVFLESTSFEACIRSAVYLGGDCDTVAAIACSIAAPYYKDPMCSLETIKRYLTEDDIAAIEEFGKMVESIEQTAHG